MIIQHKHRTWGFCRHCGVPKEGREARVWLWPADGAFLSCGPSSQAAVSLESCSFFSSGPHVIIRKAAA